jgi:amino acid adenylation domain-containing protein
MEAFKTIDDFSFTQQGIYFAQEKHPGSTLFNVGGYALLKGQLDHTLLIETIKQQLDCCDVIRERHKYFKNGNPICREPDIQFIDHSDHTNADEICLEWMNADMHEHFDTAHDLLKVRLLRVLDTHYYWYVKVHHILFDGYSMQLFFNKVIRCYKEKEQQATSNDHNDHAFSGYVQEEKKYKISPVYASDESFWKMKFDRYEKNLAFQSCLNPDPNKTSLHTTRQEYALPREVFNQIETFCQNQGLTVSHYFIGVLCLLNKLYNNDSFVLGVPIYNRDNARNKNTLGVFVKVLPLYVNFLSSTSASFLEVLLKIKKELSSSYRHKNYPLIDLLSSLSTREPLHNILFSYQKNAYSEKVDEQEATIKFLSNGEQEEDLQFHLLDYLPTEDLTIAIDYKMSSFSKPVVKKLMNDFNYLIHNQFKQDAPLTCITDQEKQQLLLEFNATDAAYPSDKTLIELFEEQVEKNPEGIALMVGEKQIGFKELNEKANRFAHYLRQQYAISPDDLVAILLDRSEWMIVSMIAVLKSGAAYVPIDPYYPQERINYMINDSAAKAVIDDKLLEQFKKLQNKYDKENPGKVNHPGHLAYVIYTSGSTGQPKGCMLEHRGVINRIDWMWHAYDFNSGDVILQKTTYTFDVSVWEIFMPLCWGTKMVLCEKEDIASPERLLLLIEKHSVSCLHFVPSMLNVFISTLFSKPDISARLKSLTNVITSGEALAAETVRKWYEQVNIPVHNLYGPTEASVDVTHFTTSRGNTKIPIGKPIWNTQMYVLGKEEQLLPVGVTGELYIGGAGLARGYLNKPELTGEKFISSPFKAGERLYKTGDTGRWLADGNIEYIGRSDDQVKIRGHRIETGEIENMLNSHAAVETSVVIARSTKDGEKELIAYLVSKEKLNTRELRGFLIQRLPDYMVPAFFMQLDFIPLNANGKTDRKKLPDSQGFEMATGVEYVAPRNLLEEKLVKIWQEVLGIEQIGVKNNFFESGGQSLKATRLLNILHKELGVKFELKEFFTKPVLEQQAAFIQQSQTTAFTTIPLAPIQSCYSLSSAQRRLWILSRFDERSAAYTMPGTYLLEGILDIELLEKSFHSLIARHESLRTSFSEDEQGEVKQVIAPVNSIAFTIGYKDLRRQKQQREKINGYIYSDQATVFDLSQGPLLKANVYQLKKNKWLFTFVMHHIISDGWSMEILVKELLLFYTAYLEMKQTDPIAIRSIAVDPLAIGLKPLRIHYKDYAAWQQDQLRSAAMEIHKVYWLKQFSGELPLLEMPTDKQRPPVKTSNGAMLSRVIDKAIGDGMKQLCKQQECTLFMGLLASVNTLLYRYTGQEDIVIGTPVACREHADLEEQIGCFMNTLALRSQFKGINNFLELLEQIKRTVLEGYAHQAYPFDELVEELNLQRNTSRNALFDIMVLLQHTGAINNNYQQQAGDLKISGYEKNDQQVSKFDLTFSFAETDDAIQLSIEYNTDLYATETIQRLTDHYEQLLNAIVQAPVLSLNAFDYLSKKEKLQLLVQFNSTQADYPKDKTINILFEEQVKKTPDEIAVVFKETTVTYKQLNEQANQLADYIRKNHPVRANDLIAVMLERSEWMIITLLGILKSGAAYVPIDPHYPQERINYILNDSQAKTVIDSKQLDAFKEQQHRYSKNDLPSINASTDLAYVLYTSGSTGSPKGCMLAHRGVVNRLEWMWQHYKFCSEDVILQKTTYTFDVSVWELFMPVCWGCRMVVCEQADISSPDRIAALIEKQTVTCLHFVPSMLNAFISFLFQRTTIKEQLKSLTKVITSGEALPLEIVKRWYDKVDVPIHNLYGPTEASVDVSHYTTCREDKRIPIGKPVWNTQLYILDKMRQLLPVGVVGEICIGGDQLAKGYLNQPELTAEKFVPHLCKEGARIYRTGDLGRWLPDGNIEYLGRVDDQVKIRGHRIELGEIENVLSAYPSITAVVVIARNNKEMEKELAAYFVSNEKINPQDIRAYISNRLPGYMVPGYFIQLETIPLNANGKADRKQLPAPEEMRMQSGTAYIPARNETEATLVEIWEELLQHKPIGVKDNFFDLGGNSLKATRLMSQVHKKLNIELKMTAVFAEPTIEAIAAELSTILWVKEAEHTEQCDANLESQIF